MEAVLWYNYPMRFILFAFVLFFSQEAFVSQVFKQTVEHNIDYSVLESEEILVLHDTGKTEVLRKIVLPKETHYEKAQETTYIEDLHIYLVSDVLKSASGIKAGDKIKIFFPKNYPLDMVKEYHEQGILESPSVFSYKPYFVVENSKNGNAIYFLNKQENHFIPFPGSTSEGVQGKEIILKKLADPNQFFILKKTDEKDLLKVQK